MRNPNSRYARRNPFGAGFDAGGSVQSNVGAGGAGPYQPPAQQGWSGTSQGFGGGKGSGYGTGKGGYGMQGQNQNYGPGFGQQQGQGFSVPWGYFNQAQQYNPLLYAGLSNIGMMPRPWQYGNSMPLFQSGNTFNQYTPQQPQQTQSGGGGFSVLPNFDQNGQIISIPNGVTWGTPSGGGEPNWIYNGSHTTQNQIPGFGDPGAGTPLNQYTGPGPWGPGTGGGGGGGGGGSQFAGYQQLPSGQYMPNNQLNATQLANGPPNSMAGSATPTVNPWEGVGGFHAAHGGAIPDEGMGGNMEVEPPFKRDDGTPREQMEMQRDFIENYPFDELPPLKEPQWVPSDVPTGNSQDGQWMKLRL